MRKQILSAESFLQTEILDIYQENGKVGTLDSHQQKLEFKQNVIELQNTGGVNCILKFNKHTNNLTSFLYFS